jgi:hypothetical protein
MDEGSKGIVIAHQEDLAKSANAPIFFYHWKADEPQVEFTKLYTDEMMVFVNKPCRIEILENEQRYITNKEVN